MGTHANIIYFSYRYKLFECALYRKEHLTKLKVREEKMKTLMGLLTK